MTWDKKDFSIFPSFDSLFLCILIAKHNDDVEREEQKSVLCSNEACNLCLSILHSLNHWISRVTRESYMCTQRSERKYHWILREEREGRHFDPLLDVCLQSAQSVIHSVESSVMYWIVSSLRPFLVHLLICSPPFRKNAFPSSQLTLNSSLSSFECRVLDSYPRCIFLLPYDSFVRRKGSEAWN